MIRIITKGPAFEKTTKHLKEFLEKRYFKKLEKYGQLGVEALAEATPKDTGLTASSWGYEVTEKDGRYTITWNNSNVHNHVNIALILQFGHGTRTGGWVEGIDYINPALKPIFEKMAGEAWMEVTNKKK